MPRRYGPDYPTWEQAQDALVQRDRHTLNAFCRSSSWAQLGSEHARELIGLDPDSGTDVYRELWNIWSNPRGNSDIPPNESMLMLLDLCQFSEQELRDYIENILVYPIQCRIIEQIDQLGDIHSDDESLLRQLCRSDFPSPKLIRLLVEKYHCDILAMDGIILASPPFSLRQCLADLTRHLPIRYCIHPQMSLVMSDHMLSWASPKATIVADHTYLCFQNPNVLNHLMRHGKIGARLNTTIAESSTIHLPDPIVKVIVEVCCARHFSHMNMIRRHKSCTRQCKHAEAIAAYENAHRLQHDEHTLAWEQSLSQCPVELVEPIVVLPIKFYGKKVCYLLADGWITTMLSQRKVAKGVHTAIH